MTLRQVCWAAFKDPLHWSFYVGLLLWPMLLSVYAFGLTVAALAGGAAVGVVALSIVCTIRRFIVGHWR